jgi:urease accessory protein UreE
MRITNRPALGALALGFLLAVPPLAAQEAQQAQEDGQDQPQVRSESGTLTWVDVDKQTFAITTAEGQELQFHFTEQTTISGGQEGVAGLATEKGASVRVEYEAKDRMAMATLIEVQPAEASQPQPAPQPAPEPQPEPEP